MKMKKVKSILLMCFVFLVSCESNMKELENLDKDLKQVQISSEERALRTFERFIINAKNKIEENKTHLKGTEILNYDQSTELLDELIVPSINFLKDYGFTNDDYYEMFGTLDVNQIQKEIAGAGILLYALETNKLLTSSYNLQRKGGYDKFKKCFLDATGIAAGIALVGALSGEAGGKAVKKAFKKVIKKLGSKLVGGIGLVLMAAEFTYCMSVKEASTDNGNKTSCPDLIEVYVPKNKTKYLISKKDIGYDSVAEIKINLPLEKKYNVYDVQFGYAPIEVGEGIPEGTPCLVKLKYKNLILGSEIDKNSIEEFTSISLFYFYQE